ncbi:MAG TPA: universal stress protein [Desulfobacteraceae bacterium]|jgi:nucleotide-binding universal stress UspA family protein|nr:universal stress protein [Desulfobacteraceae bacterium]
MNILVAMDDSDFARKALAKAIEMTKYQPSQLFILSVAPLLGAIDWLSPAMTDKLKEITENVVKKAAATAKKAGIAAQVFTEEGVSPADNIITFADENNIDLIVVGHRGKANLEKFLLGSVASRVISHASCSVLIVK